MSIDFMCISQIELIKIWICKLCLHTYCLPWVVNNLVQLSHRFLFLVHKSYWYVLKYYRMLDSRVVVPPPIHRLAGNSIRLICVMFIYLFCVVVIVIVVIVIGVFCYYKNEIWRMTKKSKKYKKFLCISQIDTFHSDASFIYFLFSILMLMICQSNFWT